MAIITRNAGRGSAAPAPAPAPPGPTAAPTPARGTAQARRRASQGQAQTRQTHQPVANFALTPYQAVLGIIDYTTTDGRKHFKEATSKLNEHGFDCQPDNLRSFIKDISRRANAFGWNRLPNGFLNIPNDLTNPTGPSKNLIEQYGEIDLEHIKRYDMTYIGTPSREAQDNRNLYECIMATLTKEAKDIITIWEEDYWINNEPSGTLLFKVVVRESYVDTNATTSAIRSRLSSLDLYMPTINSNIKLFNTYVKQQLEALAARGETTQDLMTNLFKGYLAASDRQFNDYIKGKLLLHEEGKKFSCNQLMLWAKSRYQVLVDKKEWNTPSPEETQILALKAEIKEIKSSKKKNQNNKERLTNGQRNERQFLKKPKWMFEEPAQSEIFKPKTWNDSKWYWCGAKTKGQCEAYRIHKGKDCQGKSFLAGEKRKKEKENKDKPTPEKPPRTKTKVKYENNKEKSKPLKLASALSKIVVEDDDNSEGTYE